MMQTKCKSTLIFFITSEIILKLRKIVSCPENCIQVEKFTRFNNGIAQLNSAVIIQKRNAQYIEMNIYKNTYINLQQSAE